MTEDDTKRFCWFVFVLSAGGAGKALLYLSLPVLVGSESVPVFFNKPRPVLVPVQVARVTSVIFATKIAISLNEVLLQKPWKFFGRPGTRTKMTLCYVNRVINFRRFFLTHYVNRQNIPPISSTRVDKITNFHTSTEL